MTDFPITLRVCPCCVSFFAFFQSFFSRNTNFYPRYSSNPTVSPTLPFGAYKLAEYTPEILEKAFQFVDFIKATKQERDFPTGVLEILDEISRKYPRPPQLFYQTKRDSRSSSRNIAVPLYPGEWIIDAAAKRKAIKNFTKILLEIGKTNAELDPANYKIIPFDELLTRTSRGMHDWNNRDNIKDKGKGKSRRDLVSDSIDYIEDMDVLNASVGPSNHSTNPNKTGTSKQGTAQVLSEDMEARIVELMQQTLSTFMKTQSRQQGPSGLSESPGLSRPPIPPGAAGDYPQSRSPEQSGTSKWNPADIGFFDPHYNGKTTATAPAMEHSGKDTYFRDIHLFLERCSDIATVKGEQLVRDNLFTCLRGLALQWYTSEMTSDAKTLVKYAPGIEHWSAKLLGRFKEKPNVALATLMKEKYTFEDARKQREPREYASIILRAAKSTNLATSDQVSMIWNGLDAEFQRDIRRPSETTVLDEFLNSLDEFKDIWWQLARRRMPLPFRSSSSYRISQYQSPENTVKSYGNTSGASGYRRDYTQRSNYPPNTYLNSSNRQQFTPRPWISQKAQNAYQPIRQPYQSDQKDRQAPKDLGNPPEFPKPTGLHKPQHPIYNKFQKYPADPQYPNSSYQQKAYHGEEDNDLEEPKNIEDQENYTSNYAGLDDEGHELYYEEQSVKEEDETFVGFVGIESTCKRCGESFSSRNLLHSHIRKALCLKRANQVSKEKPQDKVAIITSMASTSDQGSGLGFRSWNFLQAFIKLIPLMKAILVCLDTGCGATLADRSWILTILPNVQIKKMDTALRVKGIGPTTHESMEFIVIPVYFPGTTKNGVKALASITREIHLVDDLKAKMLIGNDFLGPEGFVINIEEKIATINSCNMEIPLQIMPKGPYVRKTVHAQYGIVLQPGEEQLLPIKAKIPEGRDFFFEPDSSVNVTMCSHVLDVNTSKILVKNETDNTIKVPRRYRLGQISEVDCDNCFQIADIDLAVRPPKKVREDIKKTLRRTSTTMFAGISPILPTTGLTNMETRLSNGSMAYGNDEARSAYARLVQDFPSLWQDNGFIDIPKDEWMRIPLKSDWQSKLNGKSKIYPLGTKDREVLDRTFDELHQKGRLQWTNKATPFAYPVFVTWKTVNGVRKGRAVVDIRGLNDLIIPDAYPIPLQAEIISDLRDCSHISVLDASSFFYQWHMHPDDTYKLTVVTHRGQETFLVPVMGCRNSVAYVQRQMDTLLRRLEFARAYIDDIVVRSKSLQEHLSHLRQLFNLFVNKNIGLNPVKVFLGYPEVTLLGQRVNALGLATTEQRLKALTSLKIPDTLAKLETYLGLTGYIRQYIHFYASISRPLQDLKTSLLKNGPRDGAKRKTYTSKMKLLLTRKEEASFEALQKALGETSILIHFNPKRVLWIDLDGSKEHGFGIMIFHLRDGIAQDIAPLRTHIEPIMFLSRLLTSAEMNYWPTELEMAALIWVVKKVRHLIESSEFPVVIQTDHSATVDICRQKLITATNSSIRSNIRLVRASQYLSQFSLDVRHKPGKDNVVPDALSRLSSTDVTSLGSKDYSELDALYIYNTTLVEISKDFSDRIIKGYANDPRWKKHVLLLDKNDRLKENAAVMSFVKEQGLIYYIDALTSIKRLCIPKDCVREILDIAHGSGHAGYARTHDLITKSWYIHGLTKSLRKYIQHCPECLTCQIKRHKPYGSLQSIDSPPIPFHTIAMDFVLALPHEEIDNVVISPDVMLTVTDKFSKRVLLMVGKSTFSANDWANVLVKYLNIADWGYPMVIVSDRDRKFLSDLWKSMFKTLGIDLLYSTAYHPQTDGSSERTNQTVEVALRHYLLSMDNPTDWPNILPRFQAVLNNSPSASTSKTANEILYGFKPNQPLDLIANIPEINIPKARIEAADAIAWSKLNHKRNYDKKHQPLFLKEGSWAYLRMHHGYSIPLPKNMTAKWSQRRIGPFKIIKKIGNLAYRLNLPAHWKIHPVVSIQQLEPAPDEPDPYNRVPYDNPPSVYVEGDTENDKSYEIERLLNKRVIKRGRGESTQYLVRWKGYGPEDDRWYPISSLGNAADLIADYERSLNSSH